MMRKRRAITMDFRQMLSAPGFYAAVAGVVLLCFLCSWEYLRTGPVVNSSVGYDVIYFFELLVNLSMFKKVLVMLAAIPFTASFCSDWNCQYIRPVVVRSGVRKYAWSKVLVCAVSSFAAIFVGMLLYAGLLSIQLNLPLYSKNPINPPAPPYGSLLGSVPLLYLMIILAIFSLAAALWCVVGLMMSAFIPNRFVAIATPLIASYLLEELSQGLPPWLDLYYLTRARNVIGLGAGLSFAYTSFVFLLLMFFAGLVFVRTVKRRVRNELV